MGSEGQTDGQDTWVQEEQARREQQAHEKRARDLDEEEREGRQADRDLEALTTWERTPEEQAHAEEELTELAALLIVSGVSEDDIVRTLVSDGAIKTEVTKVLKEAKDQAFRMRFDKASKEQEKRDDARAEAEADAEEEGESRARARAKAKARAKIERERPKRRPLPSERDPQKWALMKLGLGYED